ncbi:DNA ligase 1-like [Helianthus annuus]|uniref:DNA ligase 1-like n=1 Tax=Helianthus annuus TaxID=4232 RepID=UPI000B9043EB|nr:DNA ligase 1-like [Helianthus annuus]
MGYNGPLNNTNYLKACFMKPYKFFTHSVIHALSHRKGGYDVMKDCQMCIVTALVLNKKYNFSRIVFHYMKDNITSGSRSWVYPRFVQMMLDHACPNLVKDEQNDLMQLHHMDNETLIRLSKYTKNWPEPKKREFFGFVKDDKYEDPDLVNHLKWRNDAEMKEKSAINELNKLEDFYETRNDWYTKVEKGKKKGGKRTPTPEVQAEEGSSSQPQKKRKKKTVETLLVDEPEVDETEANVEKDQDPLTPETEQLLRDIDDTLEAEKAAKGDTDDEVDRWIKENYDPKDREKQKKRKRSSDDDDKTYVPPEDVQVVKSPSSGGRKKSTSRKRVGTPAARKLRFKLKIKPIQDQQTQPTPEPQSKPPSPPQNQLKSPPPQQPSPDPLQSPQSPSQHHISSPIHEQPPILSPHAQQTPPTTQPPVHTTPGSSGFEKFPHISESTVLEQLDDFSFVNDDLVKKLQKKVNEVLSEKKKLEERVKSVESENSSLLKKIEADQADIDILKVRIAVLEEEKSQRDEQNAYFKLKNKELEANNAKKEHEEYMLKKVLEDLIRKPIEQKFEEIELAEVRARREAEMEAGMKDKGKGVPVEDDVQVTEREIVLTE